jgi:hypothetical protein
LKRPIDNARGPAGGFWIWKCPETGLVIKRGNYPGIYNAVKSYKQANHFPITAQFSEELDANLCANAQPQTCEEFTPPTVLEKMGTLARALFMAAKTWRHPLVTADVLQARRDICAACNYYTGSKSLLKVGCTRCGCTGLKLALAASHCAMEPQKWGSQNEQ